MTFSLFKLSGLPLSETAQSAEQIQSKLIEIGSLSKSSDSLVTWHHLVWSVNCIEGKRNYLTHFSIVQYLFIQILRYNKSYTVALKSKVLLICWPISPKMGGLIPYDQCPWARHLGIDKWVLVWANKRRTMRGINPCLFVWQKHAPSQRLQNQLNNYKCRDKHSEPVTMCWIWNHNLLWLSVHTPLINTHNKSLFEKSTGFLTEIWQRRCFYKEWIWQTDLATPQVCWTSSERKYG